MLQTICKIAILATSGLLVLAPLFPQDPSNVTGAAGLIILLTSLPTLGSSYKRPTYLFLALSVFLFVKYRLSWEVLAAGVNSMLAIAAIVAVLQVFAIPIKVGNYDRALERYLRANYRKEVSLYVFLHLVTHVLGSFMLFGCVPMLFSIFYEPLEKMVRDARRFLGTAISRSFSLVTLWAPGTINVILVLQITGAKWLQVLLPAASLALLGLLTSVLLESKLRLKEHPVQAGIVEAEEDTGTLKEDIKKIRILVLIAVTLVASLVIMESFHVLTSTTRVIAAGLVIAFVWIMSYAGKPGLASAWRTYWENSVLVARDLAALFIAMGIFAEAVHQSGLFVYLQSGINSSAALLGQYIFLLIPPVLILLSLVGIHPFISILLTGKMLVATVQIPGYEVYIALSLLLGGVISFVISPLAGTVLTISRMAGYSSREVGLGWNGLFSLVFLLEGFLFLLLI